MSLSWRYELWWGPLPRDHPALECGTCEGRGLVEFMHTARICDIEPHYGERRCEDCDGEGYFDDVECSECGQGLFPVAFGVGLVASRRTPRGREYRILCGPCAWEDLVSEPEESPQAFDPRADTPGGREHP